MSIPVETLSYIGVMAVMLVVIWRIYTRLMDNHKADIDKVLSNHKHDIDKITADCMKLLRKLTIVETKQDIYLHEAGFDLNDVNSTIKSHMEELESNGSPSIGCIDVGKLKRRSKNE